MSNRINQVVIFLMLIIGFFFPTSIGGVISLELSLIHSFIAIVLLLILFLNNRKQKKTLVQSYFIIFFLILFTVLNIIFPNPVLDKISLGSFLPFIAIVLLFSTSFTSIKLSRSLDYTFSFINFLLILGGLLTIFDNPIISNFIYNNYSMGYDQLSVNMLTFNKPINMFGSHSIASMFYYIFFYIAFTKFKFSKNKLNLLLAIIYLVLIVSLKSVAAYVLFFIGIVQVLMLFFKERRKTFVILLPFVVVISFYYLSGMTSNLVYSFTLNDNGFIGRYSVTGVLTNNFEYIKNNILPLGLWISDKLYFTDSGFVVNYMKGSIFLVFALYSGLYLFFKHNISHKRTYLTLFFMFLAFEIGYPILTYIRMLYFLPFIVIYLNHLTQLHLEKELV